MPKRARDNSELRFADIASVNPRTPLNGLDPDAPVSFIPMADVDDGGRWVTRQTRPLREVKTGYSPFADGDILFAKITPCTENGKGCHARDLVNGVGFGSTEFHVLRAKKGTDPRLVFHLAQSSDVRWKAAAVMDGSAGQQRVPADFFKICRIAPDILDNQDAKCDLFDAVDAAIDATRGVIEQTRRLKTAVLQDLLTRGLPGRHSECREVKGLGQVPRAWSVIALGDLLEDLRYGTSAKCTSDRQSVAVLRIPNIVRDTTEDVEMKWADLPPAELKRLRLMAGDVVLVRTNGNPNYVGRSTVFSHESGVWAFASYLIRARCKRERLLPEYLHAFLSSHRGRRELVGGIRTSAGNYNLNTGTIRTTRIPLPDPNEQGAIIGALRSIEQRVGEAEAHLFGLSQLKTALSQALLTGRVRVPAAKGVPVAS